MFNETKTDRNEFGIDEKLNQKIRPNPGPGNYEDKFLQTKQASANWNFGTGERPDAVSNDLKRNPGPGKYDNHSMLSRK